MTIKKIYREPLLHFFVLGALLFALFAGLNQNQGNTPDEIVISDARVANLTATFSKTWQRPPTEQELQGLIDAWIREEVLYREGLAIGFDRDDPIVRRRIAQKMSFVADGMVPDMPDDDELRQWLQDNSEQYEIPPAYTFNQVYFDPQRHADDLDQVLQNARMNLESNDSAGMASHEIGDATLLPGYLELAPATEIARTYGSDFADALSGLEPGTWHGPVRSGYGLHFVKIEEVLPGGVPAMEDVRGALERDVLSARSQEINEAFYQSLRERYEIRRETAAKD